MIDILKALTANAAVTALEHKLYVFFTVQQLYQRYLPSRFITYSSLTGVKAST